MSASQLRNNILAKRTKKSLVLEPSFLKNTDTPKVEVRVMSVGARAAMLTDVQSSGKMDAAKLQARVVIESLYFPGSDEKVFSPADQEVLIAMPTDELDEIAEPALQVNGLAINSLEVAEKN